MRTCISSSRLMAFGLDTWWSLSNGGGWYGSVRG